ncbi:rod shape-determining protein [Paraburkholderia caribensis MBA4]|uniref:Rod shape-determining protein n=1 Tax=Paraburkholderia caribensis MBA4 TaxID=1323664 RepID=A0A0P0R7F1_9BURK|nr:rod shape-determining protein [Paraburkholderia caribensis MBA4]
MPPRTGATPEARRQIADASAKQKQIADASEKNKPPTNNA